MRVWVHTNYGNSELPPLFSVPLCELRKSYKSRPDLL